MESSPPIDKSIFCLLQIEVDSGRSRDERVKILGPLEYPGFQTQTFSGNPEFRSPGDIIVKVGKIGTGWARTKPTLEPSNCDCHSELRLEK
jgi:hypothetical protein